MSELLQCVYAFLACSFIAFWYVMHEDKAKTEERKQWICKHPFGALVIFIGLYACTLYSGSKTLFTWGQYIQDAGTDGAPRSWATNDVVHVEWYAPTLPADDTVFVAYRQRGSTNEWQDLANVSWLVGAGYGEFTMPNATNYQYYIYSEYVPPSPVVTNGVYHLSGFSGDTQSRVVPLKVSVNVYSTNGIYRIAPINEGYFEDAMFLYVPSTNNVEIAQ